MGVGIDHPWRAGAYCILSHEKFLIERSKREPRPKVTDWLKSWVKESPLRAF